MTTSEVLREAAAKMEHSIEVAKEELASIRTGRVHPGMFNKVLVDYYGSPTPLQQLASFQNQDARTVIIAPFDKSAMKAIEKALGDSDLGVNPSNDGVVIRIVVPSLTEERRKEYIKLARHKGEDAKVAIRNIRRHAKDTLDKLVKDGEIGEDDGKRAEKELDESTKRHADAVDVVLKAKESELLEV